MNEICSASPFSGAITEEEIYPTLPNGLNGALDGNRVKTYLKNSMYPLMYLFGKNSMPDVDNLLTSFYQLDDEARKEVVETIQFKLQYHRDPERAEQIKQIKGWKKNSASESTPFTCTYLVSYPLQCFSYSKYTFKDSTNLYTIVPGSYSDGLYPPLSNSAILRFACFIATVTPPYISTKLYISS